MASGGTSGGGQPTVDWAQLALVVITIAVLVVGATLAPGFVATAPGDGSPGGVLGELLEPDEPGESDGDILPPDADPGNESDEQDDPDETDSEEDGADEAEGEDPGAGVDAYGDDAIVAAPAETTVDHDEFTEPSEEILFYVHADRPAYWRVTAYDAYDENQWSQRDAFERDRDVPASGERDSLPQLIEPHSEMRAIPAAWQPVDFDSDTVAATFDNTNGLIPEEPLTEDGPPAPVLSLLPPDDRDRLNEVGTSYPDHIEERYLEVSPSISERAVNKTDAIASEAETPYETAVVLTYWLRANHNYSLDVPPPDGEVTDELLFERDEAFCAYFATALTNMLRTQGVPARYVTGYVPGEFDESDDRFVVRGMHAHAWVEVYFPRYGWVPFEPTPAEDREETLEDAVEEGEDSITDAESMDDELLEEVIDGIDGIDPETLEDGEFPDGDEDDEREPDGEDPDTEYDIEVVGDVLPDERVAVIVTRHGEPVPDAAVVFNGEKVGITDGDGTVEATVPWVSELNVTVTPPDEVEGAAVTSRSTDTLAAPSGWAYLQAVNRTVPVDGELNLSVDEPLMAGSMIEVGVTHANRSVFDATVSVDGEPVGTTDPHGNVTISLPDDGETVLIGAERGEFETVEEFDLLHLDVEIADPPIAGLDTTVVTTANDEPFGDVEITVDDQEIGTTDGDGNLPLTLPHQDETVLITAEYRSVRTTVEVNVSPLIVDIDARPMPGKDVPVEVVVGDEPLANATVSIDGEEQALTDTNGLTNVTLPDDTGISEVVVGYGSVTVEEELDIRPLEIEHTTAYPLPLRTSEFVVTWDGDPVGNASIAFSGSEVGSTDEEGVFATRLPIAAEIGVIADRHGATASETVDEHLQNVALMLVVPLLVVGGIVWWQRRRLAGPANRVRGLLAWVAGQAARLPRFAIDLVVRLGRWIDRVRVRGWRALDDLHRWVRQRLREWRPRLPELVARARRWLEGLHLRTLPRRLVGFIVGLIAAARGGDTVGLRGNGLEAGTAAEADADRPAMTIRTLWNRFVELVRPPRLRTTTPGEIKRYAIDRGFPAGPVETVVEAFRRVEYGSGHPSSDELSQVKRAIDEVTAERSGEEGSDP